MKKIVNKKYLNSLLVGVVLLSAQVGFAGESGLQNNLLKMDVYKTSKSGVKVTLYTSHPYKEPLVVNKKSDREYVIYMPETANSMTSRPTNKSASDIVQNVDIKSQQSQGKKGYTKVVISTSKATEITPQVQTLTNSSYKMSDAEYKNLMSHVSKKSVKATIPAIRPKQTTTKLTSTTTQKTATVKQSTKKDKIALKNQNTKASVAIKPQKKVISTPKIVQKAIRKFEKSKATPKIASVQKPVARPVVKTLVQQTAQKPLPKTVKPVATKVQTPLQTANAPVSPQTKQIVKEALPEQQKVAQTPIEQPQTAPQPTPQPKSLLSRLKHKVASTNIFYLMALTLLPILIILLIVKKNTKKAGKMPNDFNLKDMETAKERLKEQPMPKDFSAPEGDWKDTFKSYVAQEKENEIKQKQEYNQEQTQNIDTLFDDKSSELPKMEDIEQESIPKENVLDQILEPEENNIEENDEEFSLDEIFGGASDEKELVGIEENPDLVLDNIEENDEDDEDFLVKPENSTADKTENLVKSSYSINENSGFYLVDYGNATSLIGYIGEEIFVLKNFERKISGKIYTRLSERKGSTASYMVKVAGFKALVEVALDNMRILIEL